MLCWAIFAGLLHFGVVGGIYAGANVLLLFVLFGLLGWQTFGAPLHK
jgi:hypothetical protein